MPEDRATVGQLERDAGLRPGFQYENDLIQDVDVADVTGGMYTAFPRDKIPANGIELGLNARSRTGALRRRPGTTQYGADTGDEPVISLATFSTESIRRLVRVTTGRISVDQGSGSWVDFATGSFRTRFSAASYVDNLYLANGESSIRQLDFIAETATPMADAPAAHFITNFADRILAANVIGAPYKVIWPVNGDPTDWTGVGSGESDLASGVEDLSDAIVGLFGGLGQTAIILRLHSIWIVERLPDQNQPFRFTKVWTKFGCDMPYTAVEVPGGIIFGNYSRNAVYFFQPGQAPVEISKPIRDRLYSDIGDPAASIGAYDPYNDEYHLGEVYQLDTYKVRTTRIFSLSNKAWTEDNYPEYTAMGWANSGVSSLFIDDLVGYIDDLLGFINDLVTEDDSFTGLFKAGPSKVFYMDDDATLDYDGVDFEYDAVLPNLSGIHQRRILQAFGGSFFSVNGCQVSISASVDKVTWRNVIPTTFAGSGGLQEFFYRRVRVKGNNLFVRVQVISGDFALRSYWVRLKESSHHR